MDERRDEKLIYKFIQRNEDVELKSHIELCQTKFDITKIFDKSGYSPLHFAAFKNSELMCYILCDFILNRRTLTPNGSKEKLSEEEKMQNQAIL